jgi:GDP-L-fucose synthase
VCKFSTPQHSHHFSSSSSSSSSFFFFFFFYLPTWSGIIRGSGTPLRQFIYNKDLGALTVWVMRDYDSVEPIILSVPEEDEVSIRDVALMVAEAAGIPPEKVVFDTTKSDGQFKKTACNDKLKSLRPDFKFTPMKVGIQKSVNWFNENYSSARKGGH